MVEIFVIVYLALSLPATFLIAATLRTSKRLNDESFVGDRISGSKTESLRLHPS